MPKGHPSPCERRPRFSQRGRFASRYMAVPLSHTGTHNGGTCSCRKSHPSSSCHGSVLVNEAAEDFGSLDERDVEIGAGDRLAGHGAR